MAASYFPCPQSFRVSSRDGVSFSSGENCRDKLKRRLFSTFLLRQSLLFSGGENHRSNCKKGCFLVYASANKSEKDLCHELKVQEKKLALTTMYSLESTISRCKAEITFAENLKLSWTKRLLSNDNLLCLKIREGADELCRTLVENEDKSRMVSVMADFITAWCCWHVKARIWKRFSKPLESDLFSQVLRGREIADPESKTWTI